jgi:hypothetical protein
MQDLASELRRIPLPRTSVNRVGLGCYGLTATSFYVWPAPTCSLPCSCGNERRRLAGIHDTFSNGVTYGRALSLLASIARACPTVAMRRTAVLSPSGSSAGGATH